jgi:hypothetical protein
LEKYMQIEWVVQYALAGTLAVVLTSCGSIKGNQPIPEPKDGPTARLRVVTPSTYGTNVNIRGYPGKDCTQGLDGGGNILNLALVTTLVESRSGQTIGMPPSDKTGSQYRATEITVPGDKWFALSLIGYWGGAKYISGGYEHTMPLQACGRAVTFVPKAGEDYEVFFDGTAGPNCSVSASRLVGAAPGSPNAIHLEPIELTPTISCSR